MGFSGHSARKRFGQHWLKDRAVLQRIIEAADLHPDDRVLEIGPGRGALTQRLLEAGVSAVHAVELDRDLVKGLQERFASHQGFSLHQGDALETSLELADGTQANKVVANIPYNITGPLLDRLLGRLNRPAEPPYERLVLLLQKEVAQRIRAHPGSSDFSALSVRMQLLANCHCVCHVPPRCFQPQPKVQSEVISIDPLPREQRLPPDLAARVESLLKQAFQSRRKMLRNSLASVAPSDRLKTIAESAEISLEQRPQNLPPGAWIALAKSLNQVD